MPDRGEMALTRTAHRSLRPVGPGRAATRSRAGAATRTDTAAASRAYFGAFADIMAKVDHEAVAAVVDRFRSARDREATIFVAGNGGSASTASHLVNDLSKATRGPAAPSMRVIGLADNIAWFSALANDEGYERVFAGQLENLARSGDLLLVISASGNSPNLLRAVDTAAGIGMVTVAMLGFDGGALRSMVDEPLWVPTAKGAYGFAENAHTVLCDLLTSCLASDARGGG
jgi:D-sedoheptulose 7-phosphate isomerase